ncbi:putative protein OS=Streptomyces aurantiogriseus OX=66870 GN=GCM10010251_21860 PE=4 SV=1 [Streptomyces aurantiogriseus]|uniref:Uncharacterized protein n=1 Tax=Streptomyces aurantiogriseus TaxID=66870 RepID=A0A918C4T3_9ACTN|nr:hypothetical protein GCM10010251_21860 [Streptomyces aurantiogriseus]
MTWELGDVVFPADMPVSRGRGCRGDGSACPGIQAGGRLLNCLTFRDRIGPLRDPMRPVAARP